MIDDDVTELPEAVRDIARLYLDQIVVLTEKIDELHFKLRRQLRSTMQCGGCAPCQASAP